MSSRGSVGDYRPNRPTVTADGEGFQIGVRGGINYLAYIRNRPAGSYQVDLLGHGGLVLNTGGGTVSFQPEFIYNRLGVSGSTTSSQIGAVSAKAIQTSIDVPLLAKISFGDPGATRFFITVGPYAQYVLSQKISLTVAGQTAEQDLTSTEFKDRFGYGASGGIGVAIPAGPGKFTVEARALWGLGTAREFKSSDVIQLQGSIGYLIALGGR